MIIYDCEIIKGIARDEEGKLPDIKYCKGWGDFGQMGISCICAYDYAAERYRVFLEDNFDAFRKLIESTDLIIGFNSHRFDDLLCKANNIIVPEAKSWDLLAEIWVGAGLSREYEYPSHNGYGLEDMGMANFKRAKVGNGAMAPVAWQRGYHGSVIDYCMDDVVLTKMLVDKVIAEGELKNPRIPGGIIPVASPLLNWLG